MRMADKIPIPIRLEEAKALSDEIRLFILDLLSKKPMSVHEIAEELKSRGMFKNINTIRYHLQVLKDAGLIELVRTEEVKGGILKYYASKRKVYTYEVPKDLAENIEPLVKLLTPYLKKAFLECLEKYKDLILNVAKNLKPCPYCVTKHFAEYVVLEAIKLAIGRTIHDPEVVNELSKFTVEEELAT